MRTLIALFLSLAVLAPEVDVAAVLESTYSPRDFDVYPDPAQDEWATAPRVVAGRDYLGETIPGPPTEIRSRWTKAHLCLLYICPYDELNLKPDPTTSAETPRLWNWDVAEAFIGSDLERIGRYKEFQVSPQSEWVDLDIDRENPKGQAGMQWNSGYVVKARIDAQAKIWYAVMRILLPPSIRARLKKAGSYALASIGSPAPSPTNCSTRGGRPDVARFTSQRRSERSGCASDPLARRTSRTPASPVRSCVRSATGARSAGRCGRRPLSPTAGSPPACRCRSDRCRNRAACCLASIRVEAG